MRNVIDWAATNPEVVALPRPSGAQTRSSGHKKRGASDAWNAALELVCLVGLSAGIAFWASLDTGSPPAYAYWDVVPVWSPLLGLLAIGWCASRRHISRRLPLTLAGREIALACAAGAVADSWLRHQAGESATFIWFGYYWLLVGGMLIGTRIAARVVMQSVGRWHRRTLIVSDGVRSDQLRRLLQYNPCLGCAVESELIIRKDDHFVLERLKQILRNDVVEHAILDTGGMSSDLLAGAKVLLEENRVTFDFAFDSAGAGVNVACVRSGLGSEVAVLVRNAPSGSGQAWMRWKRAFDILASAAAIVLTGPLLLVIAAVVKLDGGPALHRSPRIGRGGQKFACLKFRSMVPQADERLQRMLAERPDLRAEWMANFKLNRDPRVTLVGRWLRTLSLDELPQLWNVLKGDMSLVGPRPIGADLGEQDRYGPAISDYVQLRPGITGPWQVAGRNELEYPQRVLLNSWYLHNISFTTDLNIILRTFGVVLRSKGH